MKKVACTHCGYEMPVVILPRAECRGLTVRCKNQKCKKVFEIKVEQVKQSR